MTLQSEINAAVTAFRQVNMREPNESERTSLVEAAEDTCGILTPLKALRMVRKASMYAGAAVTQMTIHSRSYAKAAKAVINAFEHAERGLEFEVGFDGMKLEYANRERENVEHANKLLARIGRSVTF